jgi:Nucleoside H+ symporter.
MTVGQVAEIAVMAILGMLIARVGFRRTIAIGALAYFARYLIWGLISLQEPSGPSVDVSGQFIWTVPLVIGIFSQLLQGVCYAGFSASAYMYVDKIAEDDIRNSAQTVYGIIILGWGPMLAAPLGGVEAKI